MMEAPELKKSIADAVKEYATQKQQERVKSLSRMNPENLGWTNPLSVLRSARRSQMVKSLAGEDMP